MKDIKEFKQELLDIIANSSKVINLDSPSLIDRFYDHLKATPIKSFPPNWINGGVYWLYHVEDESREYLLVTFQDTVDTAAYSFVNLEVLVRSSESQLSDSRGRTKVSVSINSNNLLEMDLRHNTGMKLASLLDELAEKVK